MLAAKTFLLHSAFLHDSPGRGIHSKMESEYLVQREMFESILNQFSGGIGAVAIVPERHPDPIPHDAHLVFKVQVKVDRSEKFTVVGTD